MAEAQRWTIKPETMVAVASDAEIVLGIAYGPVPDREIVVVPEAALTEAQAEIARLKAEGSPGVMHKVDKSFYELTVKECDFERVRSDRLKRARDKAIEALRQIAAWDGTAMTLGYEGPREVAAEALAVLEGYTDGE